VTRSTIPAGVGGLPDDATGFSPSASTIPETDGRRQRRLRNREAVVDTLLDLYREGNLRPSTDEIADRVGLSPRSLFRYFDDVDDLAGAAVVRAQSRILHLLDLSAGPDAERSLRVKAIVDQRFQLFDEIGHAATVTRLRAPFQPVLAESLRQNRAFLRKQVADLFAAELRALPRARAQRLLAALDILTSFESYDLLLNDQRLTPAQAKSAAASALTAVVDAAMADPPTGGP
jgi:TetR/AcrR family transcriptional regulator, regulator of autoinduction and epiphytic fitness